MTIRPGRAIGPYLTLLSLVAAASTFLAHSTGEDSQAPSARPAMTAANDAQLEACNRKLGPGDICVVQPGTYATPINPSRSGSAQARITYACPSWRDHPCIIDTAGADALTLGRTGARGALSHVTVDGFTFQNGLVRASGTGSSGIVLDHVTTRDPDELRPCATVSTEGGDGTLIAHFDFRMPPKSSRLPGAEAGCDVIHVAANVAGNGAGDAESHTTLSDGILRGGWNALEVGRCSDCTLDGVRIAGAKNHTLSVGASGSSTTRLTIKNSIVMASTGFREPIPFVAWEVAGLTLVNDAFITGFAIPAMGDASIRHEQTVKGPVTIRNCKRTNISKTIFSSMNIFMGILAVE